MVEFVPSDRHSLIRDRIHLGWDLVPASPWHSRLVTCSPSGCSEVGSQRWCAHVHTVAQFPKLETDGVNKQWDIHMVEWISVSLPRSCWGQRATDLSKTARTECKMKSSSQQNRSYCTISFSFKGNLILYMWKGVLWSVNTGYPWAERWQVVCGFLSMKESANGSESGARNMSGKFCELFNPWKPVSWLLQWVNDRNYCIRLLGIVTR